MFHGFEEGSNESGGHFRALRYAWSSFRGRNSAGGERVLSLGDLIIREAEQRDFSILSPKERKKRGGNITIAGRFDPLKVRDTLRERHIMVSTIAEVASAFHHIFTILKRRFQFCFRPSIILRILLVVELFASDSIKYFDVNNQIASYRTSNAPFPRFFLIR